MAQNKTNFDKALKIDYLPLIRDQLNNKTVLLDKIQRNERDVSGKRWQLVAHYQRNSGVGSGAETDLPTAGSQGYENPYGDVKYHRGKIQVSGPVMTASRNDKGAVEQALNSEIQGVTRDLRTEINYQLFNDGTSRRALVNGDPVTTTTLTLDTPGTQYLYDGMTIDIVGDDDGVANDSDVTISSVDSDTEVTVSAALDSSIDDDDWVINANSHDGAGITPSDSYEMMGLKGIIDDTEYVTTLHNLSRSTYNWWKCSTSDNDDNSGTNRDLTLDLIQEAVTSVQKNGDDVNMIISDFDVRNSYAALLVGDRRYDGSAMELDGGWRALSYNDIPWVADKDCPPNTVFFMNTEHLFLMQENDWDWMDKDGAVLSRTSGDAYEAALVWYAQLATDRPRSFSFLRDVE